MRVLLLLLLVVGLTSKGFSQDSYHQDLLSQLDTEFNLLNPSFVFNDTEQTNIDQQTIYGNSTVQVEPVINQIFTQKSIISVNGVGANQWDSGWGITNQKTIQKDDIILLAFYARKTSDDSQLHIFIEDNNTFEKEVYTEIDFDLNWNQYFLAIKASKTYSVNKIKFGFHLAAKIQSFEIAGFTALNLGTEYDIDDVPSIFSAGKYGGYEEDAEWRNPAASRIEEFRKVDLSIVVTDENGMPVENARVFVEMTKHDFEFGTAVVGCRFPGNNCFNQTYVDKLFDLDGEGHGFNSFVTENALKWDGWEEEWIGTPSETKAAIKFLGETGNAVRGHTLVWPGWQFLPDDMMQNQTDQLYLTDRINGRLESMLLDEEISDYINEWDVLNEIAVNRSLENAFKNFSDYDTGRELYTEIFDKVQELQPDNVNYINDYVTLSYGGAGLSVVNNYKQFVAEIQDSGAKVDGIGFQAHIGSIPTSIYKIEETLNEFDDLYDLDMKVTEYDINDKVEPEIQAKYLRDFLTIIFSHERMNGFLMWGFWDGNHWLANAPMFDINWNLKPSGQAFNEMVFDKWWTSEEGDVNSDGEYESRVFKGEHDIAIEVDGILVKVESHNLIDDSTIMINLGPVSTQNFESSSFDIVPNPTSGSFFLNFDRLQQVTSIEIVNAIGQVVYSRNNDFTGIIDIELSNGVYSVILHAQETNYIQSLIIKK